MLSGGGSNPFVAGMALFELVCCMQELTLNVCWFMRVFLWIVCGSSWILAFCPPGIYSGFDGSACIVQGLTNSGLCFCVLCVCMCVCVVVEACLLGD